MQRYMTALTPKYIHFLAFAVFTVPFPILGPTNLNSAFKS